MEKYKNSVADIELPNVRKWNSVLVLKDDQEVISHKTAKKRRKIIIFVILFIYD